jgi:hypothetical protein
MKNFKESKNNAVLAALAVLLSATLGVLGVQQAVAADDPETGSDVPLVIAAKQSSTQVLLPNLLGKTKAGTEKALANVGLKLGTVQFTTSGKGKPGTVVKQKPTANSKVAKGSAVDVVVLKAAAEISPKIVQRGDKVFMEFPETVKDVTISDDKGKKLQQFKQGKQFDVTESVLATKAGRIKVAWERGTEDIDLSRRLDPGGIKRLPIEQAEIPQERTAHRMPHDKTFIDNAEPANNDPNSAPRISASGVYSGTVGGADDRYDYVKFAIGPHQPGTLISAAVLRGDVQLSMCLASHQDAVWAAVAPDMVEIVFLAISSKDDATGETPYTISVSMRPICDAHEPNDDFQSAAPITLGNPVNGCLCLIMTYNSAMKTEDWYKIRLPRPKKIRIKIGSVGLRNETVSLRLYKPDNSEFNPSFMSGTSTNDEAEYEANFPIRYNQTDWQSEGYHNCCWRIKVDAPGLADHFGVGSPPDNFRPYRLVVEEIP